MAYQGKVYDVSGSALWKEGVHQNIHRAGKEMSPEIEAAPHNTEVLEKFPIIGELRIEVEKGMPFSLWKKLLDFSFQRHPHPTLVHFPIALSITTSFLLVLYVFLGDPSLEMASYYTLLASTLMAPATMITGFLSWWAGYQHALTHIFRRKIEFSIVLLTLSFTCSLWRTLVPQVMLDNSGLSWVYFGMVISLAPIVIILGYYGGKLTFPG